MIFGIKAITSQLETDCGPTCLAMLLDYYGIESEVLALNTECNIGISGCTMKDLKTVGNRYGLDMRAFKMDADELVTQDRPGIVHWMHNHFIIFAGVDETGKIVIVDPDRGKTRFSKETFSCFYTGYAIFNGEPVSVAHKTQGDMIEELTDEVKVLREQVDIMMNYFDGLKTIVVESGTFTNPSEYHPGDTVKAYTDPDPFTGDGWYTDGDDIKICVKDGEPTGFDDEEYFAWGLE